jgi:hypothetical protein
VDPADAKRFLIARVIAEADLEHAPLLDVEKRMLAFSESDPSFTEDPAAINDEFERSCNTDEYESKITQLLKNGRDRDGESTPDREQEWKDALVALRREDHYILVMAAAAFPAEAGGLPGVGSRTTKILIYLVFGIIFVLLLIWKNSR